MIWHSPDSSGKSYILEQFVNFSEAKMKIASQLSGEEQRKLADFVIENNGSLADLLPLKKKTKAVLMRTFKPS